MLTIKEYSAEYVKDPFGILSGKRYEFIVDLELPEDDELFSEHGIYVRVVYKVDGDQGSIAKYDLIERTTNEVLDYDLEPEEEEELAAFCSDHLPEE